MGSANFDPPVSPDTLRPPGPFDSARFLYKDWLHLNLFDHDSGSIGLFNISLHGAPEDPRSVAVGTALFDIPGSAWVGDTEVRRMSEASLGLSSVGLETLALDADLPSSALRVSARMEGGIQARFRASALSRPIRVERRHPFGSGWISWLVIPRLSVDGRVGVDDRTLDLRESRAYFDHNWGRWAWGDDIGWEWGTFVPRSEEGPNIVLARTTNRDHTEGSPPYLSVDVPSGRRSFLGRSVTIEMGAWAERRVQRLPGAMAALHQDRQAPMLPGRVRIRADNGLDHIDVEFRKRSGAQLVAGEPTRRGYTFIHELAGDFLAEGRIGGKNVTADGLAVFEYVN